jgi:LAS superfamily LD-carboxypeptidase LdcB
VRTVVVVVLCLLLCGLASADQGRAATGYKHGRAIRLRVVEVDLCEVEINTARAFRSMERAAARAGIGLVIMSGFRTNEKQAELYEDWRTGGGNLAAKPGWSNHQSGRALDLILDRGVLEWLDRNARRFGFRRPIRGEPWHWEYGSRQRGGKRLARRR